MTCKLHPGAWYQQIPSQLREQIHTEIQLSSWYPRSVRAYLSNLSVDPAIRHWAATDMPDDVQKQQHPKPQAVFSTSTVSHLLALHQWH